MTVNAAEQNRISTLKIPIVSSWLNRLFTRIAYNCGKGKSIDGRKNRGVISFLTRSPDVSLTWQTRDWSAGLVWRYTLLQIPALALLLIILIVIQQWVEMPAWLVWGLVIVWIIKDVALFPLTWRAYDWDDAGKANSMVGRHGVVQEQLSPEGSVRVRGELWRARIRGEGSLIDKGEAIRVREICGLTLVVEKVPEEHHLKDQKN